MKLKKIALCALIGLLTVVLGGCSLPDLTGKSVVEGAGGLGGKFTTSIDATTGTPTPAMTMGEFQQHFVTHRPDDGDLVYYKEEKSMWGGEVGSRTFIWMKNGTKASVEVAPDKAISIPGLQVVSGSSTVKIISASEAAAPDSASLNASAKLSTKTTSDSSSKNEEAK